MATNCPTEIAPLSQSEQIKNQNIISLNYTNQNFWSMKARLVDFINERFGEEGAVLPNTFNDLVESSIAIMLIETWAFLADTLSFKIDQIANDLFIDTVTEPDNAFRLSRLVGFSPTQPIPSRSLWTATINNTTVDDVVIPTPVTIDVAAEEGPITIELFPADANNNPIFDQDIAIPAGSLVNSSIVGLEGITITDSFTGTGEISQTYQVTNAPVLFDSVDVVVDGVTWEEVDFFTDSQPRREYRVELDSNYNAFIIFGNNRAGLIPSSGSEINITYRVGGGTRGNIVTGFVIEQRQARIPSLEFSVPVEFTNYTKGQFGYDGDTIEDIRRKLPAFLRTQNRAVSGLDYKTLADQFATAFQGQIGKSTAVLRNHGCAGNVIDLYVLARDGDELVEAPDELKSELIEELEDKKMLTDYLCVKDGSVVSVDISINVMLSRIHRKFQNQLLEEINRQITAFFDINNWDYNQDLEDSDLTKHLANIEEVNNFAITYTTNDPDNSGSMVTTKFFEIIRPDEIDISFTFV